MIPSAFLGLAGIGQWESQAETMGTFLEEVAFRSLLTSLGMKVVKN